LAEVEYRENKTKLNFLNFSLADNSGSGADKVSIATTRPELLCACAAVAVNPNDARYGKYVGQELVVPLFGHKVPILADSDVDASFGTGVVMICTFGDKQDIRWTKTHNLKITKAITRDGKMSADAGKYEGMGISECKAAIIEDLKKEGFLYDQKESDQNVGLCWRCKTPIEILSEMQWFIKVKQDEILSAADQVKWAPDYMKVRLENWTNTMEWDWCISRQRIFATPIPVWYCNKCHKIMIAEDSWLPIDPTHQKPPVPCSCGSSDFHGETDVFDTWMDSSLTALCVSGWDSGKELRFPTQLRPQGHDIIRTWAFYTILRSVAIENKIPWETIMINGMVLGTDGHKMSKSLGNVISPEDVLVEHSADAFRQWGASGGSVGSDIMFRWNEVVSASRFIQKIWNIYRFSLSNMGAFCEKDAAAFDSSKLKQIDRWLLSKLGTAVLEITDLMDSFQFSDAFKCIRQFTWDVLADNYIELVKGRLYGSNDDEKEAARYTLYTSVSVLSKLLAPFTPFLAEEMYSRIGNGSVHQQSWPEISACISKDAESKGELIKEITSAIRSYKSDNKMALNAPLKKIEIYNADVDIGDISSAVASPVDLIKGDPDFASVPTEVKPNMGLLGPQFRDKAGKIIGALKALPPQEAEKMKEAGKITIDVGGEIIELGADAVEIKKELISNGREIDLLHVGAAVVVIVK
ncbi:MAG: valine--tRNA ligase, partial [Methanimicrococcus sp.]|nr:valine--tRNA ligase [Methanimicrococcus sp.]